jgi:hypothetical protein
MDREKLEKWIADYENPSGPDRWIDPWTWAKEMKEVLAENERLRGMVQFVVEHLDADQGTPEWDDWFTRAALAEEKE